MGRQQIRKDAQVAEIATIMKGFASINRIKVMFMLDDQPNVTIEHLSEEIGVSYFTIFDHLQKMLEAGIVERKQEESFWVYRLSSLGKSGLSFLRRIEKQVS